jgi:hypothetical protein
MSIVYRIDKEEGVSFALWHGVVTAEEFLAHASQLVSDADWPAFRGLHLSDLQTTTLDASIEEGILEKSADLYGRHPKISTLKVAIVANEAFKKAVIFERFFLRYQPSVIVFNNLETACTWLGIRPDRAAEALRSLRKLVRRG